MSVFGLRRRVKAGVKKALGIDESPSDTAAPNWQNRSPAPEAAQKAAPVSEAFEEDVTSVPEPELARAEVEATADAPVSTEAAPSSEAEGLSEAGEEVVLDDPIDDEAEVTENGPALSAAGEDVVGAPLTLEAVQEILDDMVRPALQGDGGDISLVKIEENDVYVELVGACTTCPSAIMTMKMGVEALLREEFPSMRELIQVGAQPLEA